MTAFRHTDAAAQFIATADSRETSVEILRAIAAFAGSVEDAELIWEDGIDNWDADSALTFINTVTADGQAGEAADYVWGAAGNRWADDA